MNDGESKGPGGASGPAEKRQSVGPGPGSKDDPGAERRARAAAALRANLGRRKAQARQRSEPADLVRKIGPPPKTPGAD